MSKLYLSFKSPIFLIEIPEEKYDHYLVGGDCISFICERLIAKYDYERLNFPVMEDYAWVTALRKDNISVFVITELSLCENKYWIVTFNLEKKMFSKGKNMDVVAQNLVKDMNSLIEFEDVILNHQWHDDFPDFD